MAEPEGGDELTFEGEIEVGWASAGYAVAVSEMDWLKKGGQSASLAPVFWRL